MKIAGREYPLTIDPAEESRYRKAAKEINELVDAYSKRYHADMENYLAMAALQTALMGIQSGVNEEMEPVLDELRKFEEELDELPEAQLPGRRKKSE
ncbi:MAG: cell division protein ZapA [Rikenellaceae bacterium]|nr:cell division protein ZapA [Rikenellaceae bacterium]